MRPGFLFFLPGFGTVVGMIRTSTVMKAIEALSIILDTSPPFDSLRLSLSLSVSPAGCWQCPVHVAP